MTRKKITILVFLTVFSLCSCVFPNDDHNPENGFFYKKGVSKIIAKGLTENTDLTLKIGYYPSGNYKTSQKIKEWATDFEEEFTPAIDINYFDYDGTNPPKYRYKNSFVDGVLSLEFFEIDTND